MTAGLERSPQIYARVGGLLYLAIILFGFFAEGFVRAKLIVPGDATATAANILASESLWRIAFAGELILYVCAITLVLILYLLLRPVNPRLALLAVFFNLVSIGIESVNALTDFAPLVVLRGADYLKVFEPRQREALALLFLNLHEYGFGLSLTIFAFVLLIIGYLIFRSGYFPRVLGMIVTVAGLCYLVNSFSLFLAPALQAAIFPGILVPAGLGELSLCLWLLVMGVNLPKWEEKTNRLAA